MASRELTWMERNNLTTGKLTLIVVLFIIFVSVVTYQLAPVVFRGGPAPPAVAANTQVTPTAPAVAAPTEGGAAPAPTARGIRTDTVWPQIPIADAIGYDPFRMPSSLREAAARKRRLAANAEPRLEPDEAIARREQLLQTLTTRGVDVVIVDGDKAVASIGSLELRVGDVVEGLLVKRISRDGVEIVRVDPQSGQGEP